MFQKVIISIFILFCFSGLTSSVQASEIKVENIFSDISSSYRYLDQLQELYEKWMVTPDNDGKFSPSALLQRDQFVGILTEVTCEKCIKPNTDVSLLTKYVNSSPFFDLDKNSEYFYCIASATDKWYVQWYQPGTTCEDGTLRSGEVPFCPANTITLEEAIAVILRASGIMTLEQAAQVEARIISGEITNDLSQDVSPRNLDGSINSFYPYLSKALSYEVVDIDSNGNETSYKLLEVEWWRIYPKKALTKEEFLRIAFVALKANSCQEIEDNNLWLEIDLKDKSCSATDENCDVIVPGDDDTYDFEGIVWWACEAWIQEPNGYIWRHYHIETGEEIFRYGKYIDNYQFLKPGDWRVYLRVIDRCWNTWEVYNTLHINWNDLGVSIEAVPVYGNGPLKVNLESFVSGGVGPYGYAWNFWDGSSWFGRTIDHIFTAEGTYTVTLVVTDSNGDSATATVLIKVVENTCTTDSDGDWVNDCIDKCPLIYGDNSNLGCPIYDITCSEWWNSCPSWYSCQQNTAGENVCLPELVPQSCLYTGGSTLFGNTVCNTCPCANSLDFNATIRHCDVLFPAITSPDGKSIYSKGNNYIVPNR